MKNTRILLATATFALAACSSNAPRADIADSANPQDEISKLDKSMSDARTKNVDVLASDDFKESQSWLDAAKKDSSKNKKQSQILDDLRKSTGYLNRANKTAEQRAPMATPILDARQAAIKAGADKFPAQKTELSKIDEDLVDQADKLDRLKAEKVGKFEGRYLDLELSAITQEQLGNAQAMVNAAKKDDGDDKAPQSFRKAQIDVNAAQNMISTHRTDKNAFEASVSKANDSADFLNQVMKEIKSTKGLKEEAAAKIVQQHREIGALNKNLDSTMSQNAAARAELANANSELKGATAQVRIQQAIEAARKEFTPAEAEVFQQGDKLVVRLKSLNFASGRSDLPSASMGILAKVKDVTSGLKPKEVMVEGHTDSLGGADVNQRLSSERAESVASYLGSTGIEKDKIQSAGYGFEKPIASNKTKTGRAQNRRVDVIITPEANAAAVEQKPATNTDATAPAAAR